MYAYIHMSPSPFPSLSLSAEQTSALRMVQAPGTAWPSSFHFSMTLDPRVE